MTCQLVLSTASLSLAAIRPAWSTVLVWMVMTLAPATHLNIVAAFGLPLVTLTLIVWGRRWWLTTHLAVTVAWLAIGTIRDTSGLFLWTTTLLQLVAVAVGILLRRARAARARDAAAREAAEQALREEVRRREQLQRQLATELHDAVASELTLISLESSHVATVNDPEALRATVASVGASARIAQGELRVLLGLLSPSADGTHGVVSTHDWRSTPAADLATETGRLTTMLRRHGFVVNERVDLPATPDATIPSLTQVTAQRILQEAVANVIRHAPAHAVCDVMAQSDATTLQIVVSNDIGAVGTRPAQPDAMSGIGLASLAERVTLISGKLAVGPRGTRWEVTATLPLSSSS
ncbi:MAG: histidine kinase [Micropruina sp.]